MATHLNSGHGHGCLVLSLPHLFNEDLSGRMGEDNEIREELIIMCEEAAKSGGWCAMNG